MHCQGITYCTTVSGGMSTKKIKNQEFNHNLFNFQFIQISAFVRFIYDTY
jgi:hypothetical protein